MQTRLGLSRWCSRKESAWKCRRHKRQARSLGQDGPWSRKWPPAPLSLPRKPHGPRSLVGYSPRGHRGLDTTERTVYSIQSVLSRLLSVGCLLLAGSSVVLFSALSTVPRIRPVREQALINIHGMNKCEDYELDLQQFHHFQR